VSWGLNYHEMKDITEKFVWFQIYRKY
jgi:hypothetical protein